jgi:hypothetical protein
MNKTMNLRNMYHQWRIKKLTNKLARQERIRVASGNLAKAGHYCYERIHNEASCVCYDLELALEHHRGRMVKPPNDPSSATRPTKTHEHD